MYTGINLSVCYIIPYREAQYTIVTDRYTIGQPKANPILSQSTSYNIVLCYAYNKVFFTLSCIFLS